MQSHKYPSEKWKTNLQVCGRPVMTAVKHLALIHLKNTAALITTQDIHIHLDTEEMSPLGNLSAKCWIINSLL